MKKLLSVLSVLAALVVLTSAGIFGYTKYKEMELKQENLQSQLDDKMMNLLIMKILIVIKKVNADEAQTQEINSTEENVSDEQQVTRDNVFDYAIAAVNEVGDADLLKFQEPEYNGSEWTINANNKSGAGANTIVVKDDGTVQIWNGPKTSMDHETKIEL